MTIIEKFLNNYYDLSDFTDKQKLFIECLIKFSYIDGCKNGRNEVLHLLINEKNKIK